MGADPWVSSERYVTVIARRVLARALRRPLRVLVIATLAAAGYVVLQIVRKPIYEGTQYFHLVEGELADPATAPRPPREIRQYLSDVALSRYQLERIMRKHGRSLSYLERDRVGAIDEFRDDIHIEVSRNYFLFDRRRDDPLRSALVTVSLSGPDPDQTIAILHDISDAILEEQKVQRTDRLAQAREHFGLELALAHTRLSSLQAQMDRVSGDLANAQYHRAIALRAQLAALQSETTAAVEEAAAIERRASDFAFSAAAERERLGMKFVLVDERLEGPPQQRTWLRVLATAVAVFGVALLLNLPFVGAFDDRIYSPEDMVVRGLPLFGALVRFPGDDAGAYGVRFSAGGTLR